MGSDKSDDSVARLGEGKIIREIFLKNISPSSLFEVPPGDDSAILKPFRGKVVVTTDMLVQDVHFDPTYFPPDLLGEKAFLVNVSDIAAMGARPLAAFIGIGIPPATGVSFLKAFAKGFRRGLRNYGVSLGGGDTVRADKIVVSITLVGTVKGNPVKRSGARTGDHIFISGIPGLSHLGLSILKNRIAYKEGGSRAEKKAVNRHLRPTVDIELGSFLREKGIAGAMIDTSDGIFTDLGHILEASDRGAVLNLSEVPVSREIKKLALRLGYTWEDVAIFGGEDYHLLFTVSPGKEKLLVKWPGNTRLFRIGSIEEKRGIFLNKGHKEVKVRGQDKPFFDHFTIEENKGH